MTYDSSCSANHFFGPWYPLKRFHWTQSSGRLRAKIKSSVLISYAVWLPLSRLDENLLIAGTTCDPRVGMRSSLLHGSGRALDWGLHALNI